MEGHGVFVRDRVAGTTERKRELERTGESKPGNKGWNRVQADITLMRTMWCSRTRVTTCAERRQRWQRPRRFLAGPLGGHDRADQRQQCRDQSRGSSIEPQTSTTERSSCSHPTLPISQRTTPTTPLTSSYATARSSHDARLRCAGRRTTWQRRRPDLRPSADGNKVSFLSSSTNLVTGDTNGVADGFARDLGLARHCAYECKRSAAHWRPATSS